MAFFFGEKRCAQINAVAIVFLLNYSYRNIIADQKEPDALRWITPPIQSQSAPLSVLYYDNTRTPHIDEAGTYQT